MPVNASFTLIYNKPLDANTVVNACNYYYLYDNNTGCVTSNITLSADGRSVTFVPTVNMVPATPYQLLARYATDLDGNSQSNYGVSFTTASGSATTPPTVVNTTPVSTTSGVPFNALIEAQFSTAVSGTSLDSDHTDERLNAGAFHSVAGLG